MMLKHIFLFREENDVTGNWIELYLLLQFCMCVLVLHWPVTGAGNENTEQVIGDEGEDDGCDGATGDRVTWIL